MPRPPSNKKPRQVKLRISDADWKLIHERAAQKGVSLSTFLVGLALGQPLAVETPKPPQPEVKESLPYLGTRDMLHPLEGETLGQLNIRRALAGMKPLARLTQE